MENIWDLCHRLAPQIDGLAPDTALYRLWRSTAVRIACKAMGSNIIIVNATGCMEVISSRLPTTAWDVPWIHTLFENTAAVASGVESALKAWQEKAGSPIKELKSSPWQETGVPVISVFRRYRGLWKEDMTFCI